MLLFCWRESVVMSETPCRSRFRGSCGWVSGLVMFALVPWAAAQPLPRLRPPRPTRPRSEGANSSPTARNADPLTAAGGSTPAPAANPRAPQTELSVELLTGPEGAGLATYQWYQLFERLQIPLTVRQAAAGEAPEIVEQTGLAVRKVRVIGSLDKSGRLIFSERTFSEADGAKLARWLREIREFGAQGSPAGQPVWGLTKVQFNDLFTSLSPAVTADLEGQKFAEALPQLAIPAAYHISFTTAASSRLQQLQPAPTLQQSVKGIARGTAFAVLLRELGLGFRPRRMADGSIELQVATPGEATDLWPIGWPTQAPNPKTAPRYFALTKIDLRDVLLNDVLSAAPEFVGLPILIDYRGLAEKNIDLAAVKVSHPARQTTWSLALKQLTFQAKARPDLFIDEAGKPFVWVTSLGNIRKAQASAP